MSGRNTGVWTVIVAMTVEALTPDEAVALVQAELAAKLPREDQSWQTEAHHLLPRYVVGGCGAHRALVEVLIDRVIVTDGEVEIRYVFPTTRDGPHRLFCHLRLDHRWTKRPAKTLCDPGAGTTHRTRRG